jgi:hypothetical protein
MKVFELGVENAHVDCLPYVGTTGLTTQGHSGYTVAAAKRGDLMCLQYLHDS